MEGGETALKVTSTWRFLCAGQRRCRLCVRTLVSHPKVVQTTQNFALRRILKEITTRDPGLECHLPYFL